jgi:hypothetical protein
VIVLDLVRRDGGSGSQAVTGQPASLDRQLGSAGDRWVLVVSHQPVASSENGDGLLAVLDQAPRVIATRAGHTHHNRIAAGTTARGGYWQITTASMIGYSQQARARRIVATAGGGVAIQTWMLDHVFRDPLGMIARQLAVLDAQCGRPEGFADGRRDRNVTLYRHAPEVSCRRAPVRSVSQALRRQLVRQYVDLLDLR